MQDNLTATALLLVAGFVAGVLNTIAGGGSLITLPILILVGLPATVANATAPVVEIADWQSTKRGGHGAARKHG